MKLLMCLKCGDIFNLARKFKSCECGESGGLYVDDLNAEITGECIPLGISNPSFRRALDMQLIENVYHENNNKKSKSDACCPEGVKFEAFFIPEVAKSIKRVDEVKE